MPPKKTSDSSDDSSSSSHNLQLAINTLSQEILENNRRFDQQLEAQRSENNGQIKELREMFFQFLKSQLVHSTAKGVSDHSRSRPEVPLQDNSTGNGTGRPASTPVRTPLDKMGPPVNDETSYFDNSKNRYSDSNQRINLPRSEFPNFSGENPSGWRSKCENYFDIFQISENYKTKMAVLHFTDEAADWFDCFKEEYPNPPWQILVDEVFDRFHLDNSSNPVDEFKRVHQTGRVGDYIKKFEKAKTRLMFETKIRNVPFYVMDFVSGLKDELRHAMDILDPVTLNQAYQFAKKAELNLDGLENKYRITAKPSFYQTSDKSVSFQPIRPSKGFVYQDTEKKLNVVPSYSNTTKSLTIDQKKALGLCFWCDEKYTPGHKCKGKDFHTMEAVDINHDSGEENEYFEDAYDDTPPLTDDTMEEHAVITMCTPSNLTNHKTLKYKGFIGTTPICALIDSGSTDSFVNPNVVHQLSLPTSCTNPLSVKIADGSMLSTNQLCKNLKFQLQGTDFEGDLRVLEIQGYDVILGMDWLSQFGLMTVDWGQGTLFIKQHGKDIKLQVDSISAKVKLCQQQIDIKKESQQGSEIFVAHLFCTETAGGKELQVSNPHIKLLLDSFEDVFQEPSTLPPTRSIDHQIPLLPDSKPINLRPYRFSHYQKLEIEKIIEELLQQSFIQPSTSPYSSPILLVKKKDGTWRLCVDYRQLNDQTIKNKYPIPIIDDLLDELKGAKFFSKLDLRSGYHQIRMHPSDIPKTAFRTHDGLFEYTVMPFGLTNVPATFQSLMNCVFKPFLRYFVLVFFDDILIYSPDLDSHIKHLQLTLQTLRSNQLFAKLSKCVFATTQIEYLGFIISELGVATDPKKIEAMQSWPTPTTLKGLRGFLGLTGYYRKFIKNYGIISRPLTELLKKDGFLWNQQAQQSFKQLKLAMTQALVLALPDFSQPFTIETDACNVGIGAVLVQNKRPIVFLSKKLGVKSQSLSTYEKELLSVLTAVTKWRHYICTKPFVIKTDQLSLKHLLEQKINTAMQHKGLSKLLGLDYTIEYKKGCDNKVADALSRREGHCLDDVVDIAGLVSVTALLPKWVEDIQQSYTDDPWIATLRTKAQEEEGSAHRLVTNHQGLLRFKNRICVGNHGTWRQQLLKEVHDSSIGGHSGIFNTYKRVKAMFFWPKLKEMVQAYVLSCPTCQMTKPEHTLTPGLL
ncbi:polyprotein [Rhynchospora pubera]|uniref:Polyprotein n=1 Tax=Rhynchospora pubera TaxID=906938 RepID=A0AAV8H988_9POAL|nr:polyprotein [Rhynchospora pubera]